MTQDVPLSLAIALKGREDNLPAILARLHDKDGSAPEILICTAGEPSPAAQGLLAGKARIVCGAADDLVPHLWRDGIRAAQGRSVALTTSDFIPDANWVAALRCADTAGTPGIGGVIDNDPAASALNWAVYFLRYSAFAPPQAAGEVRDIAADNAVYSRAAILKQADLLDAGFWEPAFHARFRANGAGVRIDPAIRVVHHGLESAGGFIRHRFAHGRRYGTDRAAAGSLPKAIALLAASPLVPAVTLARIIGRVAARGRYRRALLRSAPWLIVFVLAWSAGEALGYLDDLRARAKRATGSMSNGSRARQAGGEGGNT